MTQNTKRCLTVRFIKGHMHTLQSFISKPLWLVGFRPFFSLAIVSGALLPILWVLLFSGDIALPNQIIQLALPSVAWHAHEMFYGFGWALLGGFLLTASKNWVNTRGYHGYSLACIALLWIGERLLLLCGGGLSALLTSLLSMVFIVVTVLMVVLTLLRYRQQDSYPDNIYFILALPLFIPVKWLMFNADMFQTSVLMTLGLFRLCFLIMLERTLHPFMKGAFDITLKRVVWIDQSVKLLALLLVFAPWFPTAIVASLSFFLGSILLLRWFYWRPTLAFTRLELAVMYLGYLAITAQLFLIALLPADVTLIGTFSIHLFTLGAIGLIAPAMIIRISRGHTGRKVLFDCYDKSAIALMIVGFMCRLLGPQFAPGVYYHWLYATAICWFACFLLLGMRYVPWLLRVRIDGKLH